MIVMEIRHFYQVQDDFFDCFGKPEVTELHKLARVKELNKRLGLSNTYAFETFETNVL
uniref:Uncharacterized protein n=1 Tax=Glossina morsitans morsitans TaxID=37546 RepID=A0A1B0GEX0_GLOMM